MKRKSYRMIVGLVLILVLMLPSVACAATVKTPAEDGSLNVRSGPGTKYSVAGWVKNGETITVLETATTWSKIQVKRTGTVGYINTKYIREDGTATLPDWGSSSGSTGLYDECGSVRTKYATSNVNMRAGAGSSYPIITSLKSGTPFTILNSSGNWYQIRCGAKEGYISKNYTSLGIKATVTGQGVRLRQGGSTADSIITSMAKGTAITVLAIGSTWSRVKVGELVGYMSNNYYQA